MAIDSKLKRNSAMLDLWPVVFPDGLISQDDRATMLSFYTDPAPSSGSDGTDPIEGGHLTSGGGMRLGFGMGMSRG